MQDTSDKWPSRRIPTAEEQLQNRANYIKRWLNDCTPDKIKAKEDELVRIEAALELLSEPFSS